MEEEIDGKVKEYIEEEKEESEKEGEKGVEEGSQGFDINELGDMVTDMGAEEFTDFKEAVYKNNYKKLQKMKEQHEGIKVEPEREEEKTEEEEEGEEEVERTEENEGEVAPQREEETREKQETEKVQKPKKNVNGVPVKGNKFVWDIKYNKQERQIALTKGETERRIQQSEKFLDNIDRWESAVDTLQKYEELFEKYNINEKNLKFFQKIKNKDKKAIESLLKTVGYDPMDYSPDRAEEVEFEEEPDYQSETVEASSQVEKLENDIVKADKKNGTNLHGKLITAMQALPREVQKNVLRDVKITKRLLGQVLTGNFQKVMPKYRQEIANDPTSRSIMNILPESFWQKYVEVGRKMGINFGVNQNSSQGSNQRPKGSGANQSSQNPNQTRSGKNQEQKSSSKKLDPEKFKHNSPPKSSSGSRRKKKSNLSDIDLNKVSSQDELDKIKEQFGMN